ncbi:hypothetical protein [Sagittula sp. S175]|uniref:hypothetical protein n=1 Tax=Sagittula sp. S175 TaxID=3415129 RepID=UPI003C7BEA65
MTDANAIRKLLEQVEAGTPILDTTPIGEIDVYAQNHFHDAYNEDSIDAAKALHEALLPGWAWCIHDGGVVRLDKDAEVIGMADCPARAWLLAILRALSAQGGGE